LLVSTVTLPISYNRSSEEADDETQLILYGMTELHCKVTEDTEQVVWGSWMVYWLTINLCAWRL